MDRIGADHVDGIVGEAMDRGRQQDSQGIPAAVIVGRNDIVMIERGDQDPIGRAGRRDDLEDPLDEASAAVRGTT